MKKKDIRAAVKIREAAKATLKASEALLKAAEEQVEDARRGTPGTPGTPEGRANTEIYGTPANLAALLSPSM